MDVGTWENVGNSWLVHFKLEIFKLFHGFLITKVFNFVFRS